MHFKLFFTWFSLINFFVLSSKIFKDQSQDFTPSVSAEWIITWGTVLEIRWYLKKNEESAEQNAGTQMLKSKILERINAWSSSRAWSLDKTYSHTVFFWIKVGYFYGVEFIKVSLWRFMKWMWIFGFQFCDEAADRLVY